MSWFLSIDSLTTYVRCFVLTINEIDSAKVSAEANASSYNPE